MAAKEMVSSVVCSKCGKPVGTVLPGSSGSTLDKILEGLAIELFETEMQDRQCSGVEARKRAWANECDSFRGWAKSLLVYLHSHGYDLLIGG